MDELISRQAAIDAILHITNCKSVRELFEYNQEHHLTEMWSGGVNDAIDAVIGVESATDNNVATKLGTNLAEVGTDCISRQDALEAFGLSEKTRKYGGDHSGYDTMMMYEIQDTIKDLPPIQPDIVRCKNCKHWIPYDWMFSEVWQSKNIADYPEDDIGCDCCDMAMKANDFCSRAERREDARLNQQTGGDSCA